MKRINPRITSGRFSKTITPQFRVLKTGSGIAGLSYPIFFSIILPVVRDITALLPDGSGDAGAGIDLTLSDSQKET